MLRGQVVRADVKLDEPKLYLVVSNNLRNRNFPQVLCARLTQAAEPGSQELHRLLRSRC